MQVICLFPLVCAAICKLPTKGELHNSNLGFLRGILGRPPPWIANEGTLRQVWEPDDCQGRQPCPLLEMLFCLFHLCQESLKKAFVHGVIPFVLGPPAVTICKFL